MRDAFNTELNKLAANDEHILLLTADIGFQVFDEFRENYPDRFYNVGVAESNMMGMATGLALSNKKPFVYTIIPFLTMRAFEQIRTDICIMNQSVKIVGVGGLKSRYLLVHWSLRFFELLLKGNFMGIIKKIKNILKRHRTLQETAGVGHHEYHNINS